MKRPRNITTCTPIAAGVCFCFASVFFLSSSCQPLLLPRATEYTIIRTFMRLASIRNCSEPVLGGAQKSKECSTFTIVSDSRSHSLLFHPAHGSSAMVEGQRGQQKRAGREDSSRSINYRYRVWLALTSTSPRLTQQRQQEQLYLSIIASMFVSNAN